MPSRVLPAVESMDEETRGRVSELLSEASRLLSSSTSSNAASNSTRPATTTQATINETLRRAQGSAALKHGIRNLKTETETESNINDRKLKNFTLHNLVQSKENLF